jgi:hypothetical protein
MFRNILDELSFAIGIMEYWNDGIMGSGKMWQWFIGKISLIPLLAGPIFHHSIIPCSGQKHCAPKNCLNLR